MALGFNFNAASSAAAANLQRTDRLMQLVLARLSSGVRFTRAAEDPGGLVIANTLRHRTEGLTIAGDNIEEGISMVQTAEGAMGEVSGLLTRLRGLVLSAANSGANDGNQLTALQTELDTGITSITRLATDTAFGGKSLMQGALADNTLGTTTGQVFSAVVSDATKLPGGIQAGSTLTVNAAALTLDRSSVQAAITGAPAGTTLISAITQAGTALDAAVGGSVTITGPLGSRAFAITSTTTLDQFVGEVNAAGAQLGVTASYSAGVLAVTSTSFGDSGLTIASSDMTSGGSTVGLLDSDTLAANNAFVTAGTNQTLTLDYVDAAGTAHAGIVLTQDGTSPGGRSFSNLAGGPELTAPFTAFDPGAFTVTVRDSSAGAATMAVDIGTYLSTRVSTTRIQTGDRANQRVAVEIPDMRAGALGRSAGLASIGLDCLQDLIDNRVLTTGRAQEALQVIDAAINEVAVARGAAGALQSDTLEAGLASLQVSYENLIAAESQIRDTDFAVESAEFARQNILLQAATAMLAQANQVPQSVLQLLQNFGR